MSSREVIPGAWVKLSYEIRLKRNGELIASTLRKVKEDAEEKEVDKPVVIKVGKKELFFEDHLLGVKEGEEKEVELPPDKAFGKRDPKLVETVPIKLLRKLLKGKRLEVGKILYDERGRYIGKIVYIGSRDAVIDKNPPYAGEDVIVKFKVHKVTLPTDSPEDIIRAILEMYVGDLASKVKVKTEGDRVRIETDLSKIPLPRFISDYSLSKANIAMDIVEATNFNTVEFVEVFSLEAEKTGERVKSIAAEAPVEAIADQSSAPKGFAERPEEPKQKESS